MAVQTPAPGAGFRPDSVLWPTDLSADHGSVKLQDTKLTQRNPLHSYTLTMRKQREIKETIPFTIATKRIKHLGINLPKETKDLYISSVQLLSRV